MDSDADGDLEELEDLEDLDGELSATSTQTDYHTVVSLEALDAAWASSADAVFQSDDDVVTLRDEVFSGNAVPDDELGRLVVEVSEISQNTGFLPMEDDEVPAEVLRKWNWTGGGFDWDLFASGEDEVQTFRALADAANAFEAFTAAILVSKEQAWVASSSVGFSDSGKAILRFEPDSVLGRDVLSHRELHILSGGGDNLVLRESFHIKDLKFLKTILCVPLLFQKKPAWLLLGMRHQPTDLIKTLSPRTIS
jgi:hypothetical protein